MIKWLKPAEKALSHLPVPPNSQNKKKSDSRISNGEKNLYRHQEVGSWHLARRAPSLGGAIGITLCFIGSTGDWKIFTLGVIWL